MVWYRGSIVNDTKRAQSVWMMNRTLKNEFIKISFELGLN